MAAVRLAGVAMCAAWACGAHAQEADSPRPDFQAKFDVEAFVSLFDVRDESPFNPGNMLAAIPARQFEVLGRAELGVEYRRVRAWMSPRLGWAWETINGDAGNGDVAYIQDWGVRYVGDNLSASVGRELLYWGPGLFTSPSNPFYATVNPVNPFIEPPTRNIARVQYAFNDQVRISAISNYSQGRDFPDAAEFKSTYGLKLDYQESNYSVGGVASVRDGAPHVGFVGQVTATDALLLYADLGTRWSNPGLYPQRDASPVGWSFVPGAEDQPFLDAVVGGAYTFAGGATLTLEYRYYGAGYDGAQAADYYQLARDASNALVTGLPAAGQAAGLLQQAANPFLRGLNRNYLGAQLLLRDLVPDLSVTLLSSTNLDDGGTQLTGVVNYYLTDRSRLAADVVLNIGNSQTEYGRYVGNAVFVGYKYFF